MNNISEKKIKLLIADNDQNIINSISRTVKLKFEDEIEFSTGIEDAFLKAAAFKPDIIITDVNFNSDTENKNSHLTTAGVTLSRKIKKLLPSVKIIAISGYRNNDDVFEKIIEKDWYDYFHTKGSDDLYEKYEIIRNEVISSKTGLIPCLSYFFAPMNYGGDLNKSIYRLLHTNYKREENLICLAQIEEFYNSFIKLLDEENSSIITSYLKIFKTRDFTEKERKEIKSLFHIKTNDLDCLFNSIRITIYAEKNIIVGLWEKIISETKDHGDITKAEFSLDVTDNNIVLSVKQSTSFDFVKFIESKRTLMYYKKVQSYGDIIISSGDSVFSVINEGFIQGDKSVKGTLIEMKLKTAPSC